MGASHWLRNATEGDEGRQGDLQLNHPERDKIDFLWPDKDGTTLMDLPPQYRGLKPLHERLRGHDS